MTETTRDGFLGGRLIIEQPARGGHRAGLDALLLAAAIDDEASGRLVDLGAGVGVAGLAAASRLHGLSTVLVEKDGEAAALARRNAEANAAQVSAPVRVIEADVLAPERTRRQHGLMPDMADHLIMNPPFHPADRGRVSPQAARATAHSVSPEDIGAWLRVAASLIDPRGTVSIIFRADELPRLLSAIGGRFGSLSVLPVHPRDGAAAHRVILRGRPQGRAPFRLLPGLVLHETDGRFRPEAEAILNGGAIDRLWWA